MLYNIHYNICALIMLVCLFVLYYSRKQLPIERNRIYSMMLWVTTVSVIFDCLCGVSQSFPEAVSRNFLTAVNLGYFIFRILIVYLFALYAISLTGRYKNINVVTKCVVNMPFAIDILVILLTPMFGLAFRINENNQYIRGEGIFLLYIIALFYLIFGGVHTAFYRKAIPERMRYPIFAYIFISIFFILIQFLFPFILIESFGIVLCQFMIFLTIQRPEDLLDADTGILNEAAWLTMLPGSLATRERFHVLTIIMDDFYSLNNILGIQLTKKLLHLVAEFMKSCSGKNMLYQIAANKFCIILDMKDKSIVDFTIRKIQERFRRPWQYGDGEMKLFTKLVLVECPEEAGTVEELMDYMESAEVQKKTKQVMTPGDLKGSSRKRVNDIKRAIREALEYKRFEVFYQPIYSSEKQRIESAEALIRLKDERLGYISPEEFIPIAEQTGHILSIGKFVFDSVCCFWTEHHLEDLGIQYIDVNLSVIECMQENLARDYKQILEKYHMKPNQIVLEITETAQAYSPEVFSNNIRELREIGFELALDDYGSGFSTVSYIVNLPFWIVKIDKSIVWEAFRNEKAAIVIENVIHMLKKLKMQIVAEGVETLEQAKYLTSLGCGYLQGYYYSKPVAGENFLEILKK